MSAQEPIENDLKERLGALFQLDYELLLYDLTSTYFEGLAEESELAARGYSRDHRSDCVQIVLALVVTREGFPLAHLTLAGNTRDLQTVEPIVTTVERRFGKTQRVWVVDRGMISQQTLTFLNQPGRRYLLATRRSELHHGVGNQSQRCRKARTSARISAVSKCPISYRCNCHFSGLPSSWYTWLTASSIRSSPLTGVRRS